jgi:DNA-binding NtrC family response regulator
MSATPWIVPPERLGPEMRRVYQEGVRAVQSGAKILIRGEDGVGKKVMAAWLHEASQRADRPMVAVSSGVSLSLMDELLFGSRLPGARTPEGALERAHRGTLMLDLIEYIENETLQKLRAAFDARTVLPPVAPAPVPADVQVLMTVQPNPWAENKADTRRHEYIHLVDVELTIPPLRERRADIRVFAEHFANHQRQHDGRPPATLAPRTMELLEAHLWPMNVLDLRLRVNQAALLCPGTEIEPEFLPSYVRGGA